MPMTDLEKELRAALRPVEPEDGFAERVRARIEGASRRVPARPPVRRPWARVSLRWMPAALAASLLLVVGGIYEWQLSREREGLEARRQLIEALQVTGAKLELAYHGVSEASHAPGNGAAGPES